MFIDLSGDESHSTDHLCVRPPCVPTRRRLLQGLGGYGLATMGGGMIPALRSSRSEAQSRTDRLIRTLVGHSDWVQSVAFSPDGRTALSGSSDQTLKLWELATGKEFRTFRGHSDRVQS